MSNLQTHTQKYLEYCQQQKRLDSKTLKAYQIDLTQFSRYSGNMNILDITPCVLENYISTLHQQYKPKTVKRKIASIKEPSSTILNTKILTQRFSGFIFNPAV